MCRGLLSAGPTQLEARKRGAEKVAGTESGPIGYITPADKLNGLEDVIFAERDRRLEDARSRRQQARQAGAEKGARKRWQEPNRGQASE